MNYTVTQEQVYGKNSISGLRIDVYGDAMSRGKRDVVRMAFRILDTGIETEQSSTHVFTFAVFDVSFWLMCFPILLSDLIFNVNIFLRILHTDVIFHVVYVLFSF